MADNDFCLLVNPFAGKGLTLEILQKVKSSLATLPIHFRTIITESVEHAKEVARSAIANNESIVTLGGDGTVRAVAKIVSENHGKLAIIPAGRGNDLVKTLNIPVDPIAACQAIAQRHLITIDMAKINGECFLGIGSLGFDSIANRIANQTKWFKGPGAYLYGGLKALLTWHTTTFYLTIDNDKEIIHKGYTVAVANAKCYGGGMYLAPQSSIQDGLLDVVLIGDVPKYKLLLNIPRLFNKTIENVKGITYLRAKQIKIKTEQPFMLYADGDPIKNPPLEISVIPKALNVYVPSH